MTDAKNIEQLFRDNFARLYGLALAMLHDEEAARDVVHDIFAQLLDNGLAISPTAGYLSSMVHNRCINHIKRMEVGRRVEQLLFLDTNDYESNDWPDEHTFHVIRQIVENELSPIQRSIIETRFTDGLSFAEISEKLKLSQTAIFRHLRHALQIIRTKINRYG